jgi:ABC-type transport system involved in multi-copper enzyme maturation permease subunit
MSPAAPAPRPKAVSAAAAEPGARDPLQEVDRERFVNAVYQVARKEFLQHVRTKRLFIILGITAFLLIMVTMVFGPNIAKGFGELRMGELSKEHLVLTFYFAIGIIGGLQFAQLLSIVLTADAVCSEWSNRTIFLLLSKPVSRVAFVTGKFLGNVFTIAVALVGLFTVAYVAMQPFYEGSPSGEEMLGFAGTLGMVVLGASAFAAISLFLSTLTKSTVMSLLLVLGLWLIVFPVLGMVGVFSNLGQRDFDFDDGSVQFWLYLNPAADMQAGARLLVPDEDAQRAVSFLRGANPFALAPEETWIAALVLAGYTVVFFAASLLVVQRRNFE